MEEGHVIGGRPGLVGVLALAIAIAGCSGTRPSPTGAGVAPATAPGTAESTPLPAATQTPTVQPPTAPAAAGPVTMLVDTDVAGDDLVALTFLLSAPNVTVSAITVSGTGEAHCAGGVDVVLRLLERLDAPAIPVACGREMPLAGNHTFPDPWRAAVDNGMGLTLPTTARNPSTSTAVQLIVDQSNQHANLNVLTLGPLTNLAEALQQDPTLASRLGPVTVMGGALHVPGNLVCCGAPEGNAVAEWNIYVDPHAAQVVMDAGVRPAFVSLDGTSQVPVTSAFAARVAEPSDAPGRKLIAELFAANPFMGDGSYFLWDPLAAEMAAGYPVGSFSPATVKVEEAEGLESGFTRPVAGAPNSTYLDTVDPAVAEATLLHVLSGG
jgi:pyrimidine-specific ribonucleoside hydrolase